MHLFIYFYFLLTIVITESPFGVCVKVSSGGTPEPAILAALASARVVRLPLELEGEVTGLTFRVSSDHSRVWWSKDMKS